MQYQLSAYWRETQKPHFHNMWATSITKSLYRTSGILILITQNYEMQAERDFTYCLFPTMHCVCTVTTFTFNCVLSTMRQILTETGCSFAWGLSTNCIFIVWLVKNVIIKFIIGCYRSVTIFYIVITLYLMKILLIRIMMM